MKKKTVEKMSFELVVEHTRRHNNRIFRSKITVRKLSKICKIYGVLNVLLVAKLDIANGNVQLPLKTSRDMRPRFVY